MSYDTSETWSLKKVMDLHRGIGLLDSPDTMNKLLASGPLSAEVRELIDLGMAAANAKAALDKRLAEHQAAYDATLPLRKFQTYDSVYNGDGTWEEDIKYGIYEARTEKEAIKLAHEAGETSVIGATPLQHVMGAINHSEPSPAMREAAEEAKGTTLFLDALSNVPASVQPALHQVIKSGMVGIEQPMFPTAADEMVGLPKVEDALAQATREYNEEIELRTRIFGAPD
jgi:hypothetical protein